MIDRRQAMAGVAILFSAGCISDRASNTPSDEMQTSTGVPRGTEGTDTPECMEGYNVDVEDFDPVEQLLVRVEGPADDIVENAVANGEIEVDTYGTAPLRDGVYVESGGSFHRLAYTEREPEEVTAYELDVSWENGQEAPEGETVLAFDDLPEVDRRALELAIDGPRYDREGHPTESLDVSGPAPYPGGRTESELPQDETVWIEYEGRVYEVSLGTETSIERRTYVYGADQIASDAESFEAYVAEHHVVDLDGLPDAGRSVVEDAIDGGYEECEPRSNGLKALDERLTDETELPARGNRWYVSFESERYLLERLGWVV